jgi:hypothetical protein
MSNRNKQKRVFKARMKRYPSEVKDGITHVYPWPGAKVSRIVERDRMFFATHPGETTFLRQAVPGEFVGIDLPDGMKLADIRYVLVKRLGNDWGQARIPLTIEQTKQLKDPDFFRKVSGE